MKYINTRTGVVINVSSRIKTGTGWEEIPSDAPEKKVEKPKTAPKKKREK